MSSLAAGPAGSVSAPGGAGQQAVAYHAGQIVPAAEARVPVTTQALAYGTGVFEGIRAYRHAHTETAHIFRLDDHLRRLFHSAAVLRIHIDETPAELAGVIRELLRRNAPAWDSYVRPLAYKLALEPGTPFGVKLSGVSSQLSITTLPMGRYVPAAGLRCLVSRHERVSQRSIPWGAKVTGGYVVNALAVQEAHERGCDDAIMLDQHGCVTEASTANIFLVSAAGEVVTPPAGADLLAGLTRDTVITLLREDMGVEVIERPVHATELREVGEVFLTGTGVEVAPVISIDGDRVGSGSAGPVTASVAQLYAEAVRGLHTRSHAWLTPVLDQSRSSEG